MSQAAKESCPWEEHRAAGRRAICCAVLTVSDTRTLETDRSGALIVELLQQAGHLVQERSLVPDEPELIRGTLERWIADPAIEAVLVTGGTGISPRDRTYETLLELLTKQLPGYGELFRMLSYQEIGPAAMLSRALGGVADGTVILIMPGSTAAVRLAMEKLILPELGHLVSEARKPGP
jgi:molybdenum cofactor biosynthesis protein B